MHRPAFVDSCWQTLTDLVSWRIELSGSSSLRVEQSIWGPGGNINSSMNDLTVRFNVWVCLGHPSIQFFSLFAEHVMSRLGESMSATRSELQKAVEAHATWCCIATWAPGAATTHGRTWRTQKKGHVNVGRSPNPLQQVRILSLDDKS